MIAEDDLLDAIQSQNVVSQKMAMQKAASQQSVKQKGQLELPV